MSAPQVLRRYSTTSALPFLQAKKRGAHPSVVFWQATSRRSSRPNSSIFLRSLSESRYPGAESWHSETRSPNKFSLWLLLSAKILISFLFSSLFYSLFSFVGFLLIRWYNSLSLLLGLSFRDPQGGTQLFWRNCSNWRIMAEISRSCKLILFSSSPAFFAHFLHELVKIDVGFLLFVFSLTEKERELRMRNARKIPDKNTWNIEDASGKKWAASDDLMHISSTKPRGKWSTVFKKERGKYSSKNQQD